MPSALRVPEVRFLASARPRQDEILTPDAIAFLADLQNRFNSRRLELLAERYERQRRLDAGERPDFLPQTKHIREGRWEVARLPADILDRRVEITGPVDRKMIINALNSGAQVFMADFEDSNVPSWSNQIDGQINLLDAVCRTITFEDPGTGKSYRLSPKTAVLFVRPRGWHLDEAHVHINGQPISASIFDFSLFLFHNAKVLLARGSGPYFYLPKLESHLEARLWNDVFTYSEVALGLPSGTIKATVLIETILAAFEMHEILYELRQHSAGLNCGRWDYIFSFIKKFATDAKVVLPDRASVTMTSHFLRSYSKLLIQTCHRRNVHAMGGMAAFIPMKNDAAANQRALEQVRADKEREALDGHDGTWVAHPGLIGVATEVFNRIMSGPNQLDKKLENLQLTASDLLETPRGVITEAGLRQNVAVGLGYIEAWFRGIGCVPLFNLMEDAATAEISRAQLWQWVHHGAKLEGSGKQITFDLCKSLIDHEAETLRQTSPAHSRSIEKASSLLKQLIVSEQFIDFLTVPGYRRIIGDEQDPAVSPSTSSSPSLRARP